MWSAKQFANFAIPTWTRDSFRLFFLLSIVMQYLNKVFPLFTLFSKAKRSSFTCCRHSRLKFSLHLFDRLWIIFFLSLFPWRKWRGRRRVCRCFTRRFKLIKEMREEIICWPSQGFRQWLFSSTCWIRTSHKFKRFVGYLARELEVFERKIMQKNCMNRVD